MRSRLRLKRKHLVKKIGQESKRRGVRWESLRDVGGHEVFDLDGVRISIPRHTEVGEGLATDILQDTQSKLGKGWWR